MPGTTTSHSTGIYVQTITSITTSADLKRLQQALAHASSMQEVLLEMETQIRVLLQNFGCVFTTANPVPSRSMKGYSCRWFGFVPDSPKPLLSEASLNQSAMDRAIEAMENILEIRTAQKNNCAGDAALAGIRLGRVFESLAIAPHEPNTALGRVDRQNRRKASAKGNAKKQSVAETRKKQIIAMFNRNKTSGWARKKSSYANIADTLGISVSTVKKAIQHHEREQRQFEPRR